MQELFQHSTIWSCGFAPINASELINVASVTSFVFQVTDRGKLFEWFHQIFLPNIYNQPWYNGDEDRDVFIGNKMSILIGMPWIRQTRIKQSKC